MVIKRQFTERKKLQARAQRVGKKRLAKQILHWTIGEEEEDEHFGGFGGMVLTPVSYTHLDVYKRQPSLSSVN